MEELPECSDTRFLHMNGRRLEIRQEINKMGVGDILGCFKILGYDKGVEFVQARG